MKKKINLLLCLSVMAIFTTYLFGQLKSESSLSNVEGLRVGGYKEKSTELVVLKKRVPQSVKKNQNFSHLISFRSVD